MNLSNYEFRSRPVLPATPTDTNRTRALRRPVQGAPYFSPYAAHSVLSLRCAPVCPPPTHNRGGGGSLRSTRWRCGATNCRETCHPSTLSRIPAPEHGAQQRVRRATVPTPRAPPALPPALIAQPTHTGHVEMAHRHSPKICAGRSKCERQRCTISNTPT